MSAGSGTNTPQNSIMHPNFSSSGSYGHYLPRPESNNNNSTRSNLNLTRVNNEDVKIENGSETSQSHFHPGMRSEPRIMKSQEFENVSRSQNSVNSYSRSSILNSDYHSSQYTYNTISTPPAQIIFSPSHVSQSCLVPVQTSVGSSNQVPKFHESHKTVPCSTPSAIVTSSSCTDKESCSPDDQDEEGESFPRVCRWVDCNAVFNDRASLSRHIERVHVDQRKGDDYTCFWAACQRRYRAFNARYKLLIHMRVHSGEKPNKCTVSNYYSLKYVSNF